MKIGIDARFYGLKNAGLGRYSMNLITELEKIDQINEYHVFLKKDNYDLYQPNNNNFHKVKLLGHPYSIISQIFDWFVIWKQRLDLVHFTHFSYPVLFRGKFIVTIHDLIKNQFHDKGSSTRLFFIYKIKHWGYNFVTKMALKNSLKIITPTNYVKEELIKTYGLNEDKIVQIYEGAGNIFHSLITTSEDLSLLSRSKLRKPYLLYVGNVYPYKNVEILLDVMRDMPADKEEVVLAIVCSRSVFYEKIISKIKEKGLEQKVLMLGFVPDEDLVFLYKNALAYITASLSEGFGITTIEAMSAGCPVICSDNTCLPEVCGEAALYFDPHNKDEIINKIQNLRKDPSLQSILSKKGLEQAQKYSWERMAKLIHQLYLESGKANL